jgi:Ca-activated chloride channel family protein
MRRMLLGLLGMLTLASASQAAGLLIPIEKKLPPLAMVNHLVTVHIDDQVAITKIEQAFRNHTDRQLEAEYLFPVPKGASVRKFTMYVDGKEIPGETVESDKARKIYTDIVRRTLDPGLLEYMGNDLIKLRVFPILPKSDQKVTISYTSLAQNDGGLVEYVYPMRTNNKAASTLEKFALNIRLKSQHSIQTIYSPTHSITTTRPTDKEVSIAFEQNQALLDKDFQLFYTMGGKDIGLTAVAHRPNASQNGYFMMLVSPRAVLSKSQQVPRDMVFVLDTSGSMKGKRMDQARNALQYCLKNLNSNDRFGLINFATTVNFYANTLQEATSENVDAARRWVDTLEATGGTAIDDALIAALGMRTSDSARTFTVVFFTDGRPTIGDTNEKRILEHALQRNSGNTRIFTFGVGDDVNATMLDQLADQSRAIATYVREAEDIEAKVSGLYSKISNPVLANLKLSVGPDVKISEVYPPQLPDLFHGSQLVVFGRYSGQGRAAIKVTGSIGAETKEFVYELNFADKTSEDKAFVEDLWARRKVGYLLDQIRVNGEKKELVDEVVTLAKRYGITTPYTSFLVVPDGPLPVARGAMPGPQPQVPDVAFHLNLPMPKKGDAESKPAAPPVLMSPTGTGATSAAPVKTVEEFAKQAQKEAGQGYGYRGQYLQQNLDGVSMDEKAAKDNAYLRTLQEARTRYFNNADAKDKLRRGEWQSLQSGKLGVDLSCDNGQLRNQERLTNTAQRWIGNRNCIEIGGVWIDEAYKADMKTVTVKAMSDAYFRILDRNKEARNVLQISTHMVWVTPSNTALIIDTSAGVEEMRDAEIDALFTAPAPKK